MVRIKERRRRQRIDVALPIKIAYNRKNILAKTKNISTLGTYIEIEKRIPIGTVLDVKVKLPKIDFKKSAKSHQIRCAGIAFRAHPIGTAEFKKCFGTGIFFRSFSEKGEKHLSKYIDYFLSQEKKKGKIFMRKRKYAQSRPKRKGGE